MRRERGVYQHGALKFAEALETGECSFSAMAAVARAELGVTEAELDEMNDDDYTTTIGQALYIERRRADVMAAAIHRGIARSFGSEGA